MNKVLISTAIALTLTGGLAATTQAASQITEAEAKTLQFMHEEEKLAKDVYLTLYEKWNIRAFSNIAGAEQRHQDALKGMLDQYGVPSVVQSTTVGEFKNPELTRMYKELTTQGLASLEGALKVGGMIEELDIMDLQKAIAESNQSDLDGVYENLMRGSRNHLRAFARQYNRQLGTDYQAQLMPADEVAAILSSEQERGGGHGAQQGHGGQGQGEGMRMGQGRGMGQHMGSGNGRGHGKGIGCGQNEA